MVIITDANGNIQTPTIPENVYQGSNLANEIVFLAPLPQTSVATITFKLPNGVLVEEQVMTPYTSVPSKYNLSAWRFVLNDAITQYYGQVTFQIHVYNGAENGKIWKIKDVPSYIQINNAVEFSSAGNYFFSLKMDKEDDKAYIKFGALTVYTEDNGWLDLRYKDIEFESSISVPLKNWLMYNAIKQQAPITTTVAGTFPVLRGVPSIPHSTPSQDSWNQILNWVASINGKVANFEAGILEAKGILSYDSSFIYSFGASVFDKTTKSFYTSLVDENVGNPLTDEESWGQTRVEGYTKNEIDGFIDDKIAVHNTSENAHQNLFNAKQDALTTAQMDAVNSGATTEQIAKIGSAALTTTAQNLSGAVNELNSGKQPKNLVFTNVSVSYLNWSPSITYTDYPYQADITLTGVTANDIPEVIFAGNDAASGNYLPVAESRAGAVRIYSKLENTITIPTIIIQKVGA